MICKKCGDNISDKAKFCTSCGSKVENNDNIIENVVQPTEIKQTESVSTSVEPIVNQTEQPIVIPQVNQQSVQHNIESTKKKNNTCVFIVLGVVLVILSVVLVCFAIKKSSNNSIKVLEKALSNLEEKGEENGTIKASILIETETNESYNLSATVKYAEKNDSYDMELTLNKSILYDEINLYLTANDDAATLYAKSSLVDMLGLTSSPTDMWVYYLLSLDEYEVQEEIIDEEYSLSTVLDDKHYKFIDEENNLRHYQLIIDNELVNRIKSKLGEEELRKFEDSISSLTIDGSEELKETYYVDFYINKSNELEKISIDLTESLDDESITRVVVSFDFVNFGGTLVEIPSDAKSSKMDLETYMTTYTSYPEANNYTVTDEYDYNY